MRRSFLLETLKGSSTSCEDSAKATSTANTKSKMQSDRFVQLKATYLSNTQQELLAAFLAPLPAAQMSLEEMLQLSCADKPKKELLKIVHSFAYGYIDQMHAARLLEHFCFNYMPAKWQVWNVLAHRRYAKLERFVEAFKAYCLKEIVTRNIVGYSSRIQAKIGGKSDMSETSDSLSEKEYPNREFMEQYHSLFVRPGKNMSTKHCHDTASYLESYEHGAAAGAEA